MYWLRFIRLRLRALLRKERVEEEMDAEMRFHLMMLTRDGVGRGLEPGAAAREARRRFGELERIKDAAREVKGGGMLETLVQDVRYGARVLARHKVFTAVAVLTLALGIGANTAIFSVVNDLLLRPLPYPDAERLVLLWERNPQGTGGGPTSRANFRGWREQGTSFEGMAAFTDRRLGLTGDGEPEELPVQLATPELFRVLGVEPLLGRVLAEEDARPEAPAVAVLGHGLWQRRFGGDPGIVGRPITLNGSPVTVVGVLPPGFQWYVRSRSNTGKPAELWTILTMPTEGTATRGRFLSTVARLKPGVPVETAAAELKTIHARLEQDSPQYNKGWGAEVVPLREQLVGNVRPALLILLGAVGLVLLIACANVANLLLARAAARAKEIALRTALGARRTRVIRQLLTESLLLSLLGSLAGLFVAWWGIRALVAISPRDVVNLQGVGINFTVLAWTLGVSLVTGIVFGIAPALEATRVDLNDSLKEGTKGGPGGQSARGGRLRGALVVGEVALALVLLAGAGLLMKSFARLRQVDRGFQTENVLTMGLRLPGAKYSENPQIVAFFRQATERLRSLPGVHSAGVVNFLPLQGGIGAKSNFTVEGRPEPPPGQGHSAIVRVSDSDYFGTLGIPLLRGRHFTDYEESEARKVVLVSDSFARQYFPGEDPLGKRISVGMFPNPNPTEIVGVVGDVRYESLTDEAEPTVYFPTAELTYPFMTLVIRTAGDPAAMAPAVRRELSALDPAQPVAEVLTMNQVMAESVGRARFNTLLLGLFAGLATLLAAVGIFGVMNYAVTLRTREIGLRMALGAQPRRVLLLVLRQGLLLTLIGIGVGVACALALTRLMSGLLFGVSATDPATFAVIVLLLAAVSLLACYLPARRATRVDPLIALKYE